MLVLWVHTVEVAHSAVAHSAVPWVGTVLVVRSPSMAAASFTADASTAAFVALLSTVAPSTPTAIIAAGNGILAVTVTSEFGSADQIAVEQLWNFSFGAAATNLNIC